MPVHGRREAIARSAAHDALHDVQTLHLGETRAHVRLPVFHPRWSTRHRIGERRVDGRVRRISVHVDVDDRPAAPGLDRNATRRLCLRLG
jgi:hypothetical protein